MYNADLLLARFHGVLEGIPQDALRGILCNELYALDYAIDDNVLDTRVFTLGVLTNKNGVDVVIRGLIADDGSAGTKVGEEVEGSAEGKVERNVTLANGCLQSVLLVA